MHKKGFTLAEVLVTLGIVGVVASMTLPSLIQNYKKHVVETRLKHAYNVLSNIILKNREQMGEASEWPVENAESFVKNRMLKYVDSGKYINTAKVRNFKNKITQNPISSQQDIAGLQLKSGEIIVVPLGFKGGNRSVYILLNKNNDNYYNPGKDFFKFEFIYNQTYIRLDKSYECSKDSDTLYTGCKNGSTGACAAIIVCNGWKIPNDYPVKL